MARPQKLTDIDALKAGFNWSPDSKEIAFTASDSKMRKVNVATKAVSELDSTRYGNISTPEWSPDGKWLAYSKSDASRTSDIYILDSTGTDKTPHKVTFDSYNDGNPRFGPDGRKLFFVRSEATGGGGGGIGNASVQIYSVWLEKLDRDPDDPEERPDAEAAQAPAGDGTEGAGPPRRPAAPRPPHETKMDWAGMKHRTRQVTRMPFPVFNYTIAPDSRTIVFVTTEPAGAGSTPIVYSIQEDGRRLTRVTAGGPPAGEAGGGGGGGGFGGGISDLIISRDGRTLFFSERNGIYSVALGGGAATTAPAAGGDWRAPPSYQLQRAGKHRSAGRMGRDVRRRVAHDEIPLLRSGHAWHGLGRCQSQVRTAGQRRRRSSGVAEHHQRDDR